MLGVTLADLMAVTLRLTYVLLSSFVSLRAPCVCTASFVPSLLKYEGFHGGTRLETCGAWV